MMGAACSTNGVKSKYLPGCVSEEIMKEFIVTRRRLEDNIRKDLKEFLDWLEICWPVKKGPAPWSN
jgi:hypothetical protein